MCQSLTFGNPESEKTDLFWWCGHSTKRRLSRGLEGGWAHTLCYFFFNIPQRVFIFDFFSTPRSEKHSTKHLTEFWENPFSFFCLFMANPVSWARERKKQRATTSNCVLIMSCSYLNEELRKTFNLLRYGLSNEQFGIFAYSPQDWNNHSQCVLQTRHAGCVCQEFDVHKSSNRNTAVNVTIEFLEPTQSFEIWIVLWLKRLWWKSFGYNFNSRLRNLTGENCEQRQARRMKWKQEESAKSPRTFRCDTPRVSVCATTRKILTTVPTPCSEPPLSWRRTFHALTLFSCGVASSLSQHRPHSRNFLTTFPHSKDVFVVFSGFVS